MTNDFWSVLFCLVLPLSLAFAILYVLLYGWRSIGNTIGKTFIDWIDKK